MTNVCTNYDTYSSNKPWYFCRTRQCSLICRSQCNAYNTLTYAPIARFMWPKRDPPGADRTQVGPMLATWTFLSGCCIDRSVRFHEAQIYWHRHEIRKLLWYLNFLISSNSVYFLTKVTNRKRMLIHKYLLSVPRFMLIQIRNCWSVIY